MKYKNLTITFSSEAGGLDIDDIFKEKNLRYTEVRGVMTRYSVDIPIAESQKLIDFFTNHPLVRSVAMEADFKPKKTR